MASSPTVLSPRLIFVDLSFVTELQYLFRNRSAARSMVSTKRWSLARSRVDRKVDLLRFACCQALIPTPMSRTGLRGRSPRRNSPGLPQDHTLVGSEPESCAGECGSRSPRNGSSALPLSPTDSPACRCGDLSGQSTQHIVQDVLIADVLPEGCLFGNAFRPRRVPPQRRRYRGLDRGSSPRLFPQLLSRY